jgi:hypothetical protein
MTRDEIFAEPAGPRLDAWVAEKVMGCLVHEEQGLGRIRYCCGCGYKRDRGEYPHGSDGYDGSRSERDLPDYSTDIAAAWQVVEKFKQSGSFIQLWCGCSGPDAVWSARIHSWIVTADTVPLAICQAALLAITGAKE